MDIPREKERAGLCSECRQARVIRSDRDAAFYQCRRSDCDPDYPRYPRLPVLACRGFEPRLATEDAD